MKDLPSPELTKPSPAEKLTKLYLIASIPLFLSLTILLILVSFKNLNLQRQLSGLQQTLATPTPTTASTTTLDPNQEPTGSLATWQTYTNHQYDFSLKYPNDLKPRISKDDYGQIGDKIFFYISETNALECRGDCPIVEKTITKTINNATATKIEGYHGEIGGCGPMRYISYQFQKADYYIILGLNATTCEELRTHSGNIVELNNDDINLFNQILSTFRFLDEDGPSITKPSSTTPTSTPIPPTYSPGTNWQTVNIPHLSISTCLPPKWELDNNRKGAIYFHRDPNYRPSATYIESLPYSGGSRRQEYINTKVQYEYEPEVLKSQTTVEELTINNKSVLKIAIPSFPEVVVFVLKNRLIVINSEYQPLVNDSRSAFQKDIYTIVGCTKPL
jgi:hypothetical protein